MTKLCKRLSYAEIVEDIIACKIDNIELSINRISKTSMTLSFTVLFG